MRRFGEDVVNDANLKQACGRLAGSLWATWCSGRCVGDPWLLYHLYFLISFYHLPLNQYYCFLQLWHQFKMFATRLPVVDTKMIQMWIHY